MKSSYAVCIVVAAAGMLCLPVDSIAQTAAPPQHVPLQKSIGQAGPEIAPSLIVMNARGASLKDGKLTLTGVSPNSIVFADRPVRAAGHALTVHLVEEWAPGNTDSDGFTKDPPNATISVFGKDAGTIRDAVVVLKTATLAGDRLTFDVDVLEGDLASADGPASIFIDRFAVAYGGRGFGRGGFAAVGGVGRVGYAGGVGRVGYVGRGAWYRGAPVGAAVVGGAALGAAAAGAYAAGAYYPPPPAYYAPPPCGYYPYPSCY